jgi:hypothetical protein
MAVTAATIQRHSRKIAGRNIAPGIQFQPGNIPPPAKRDMVPAAKQGFLVRIWQRRGRRWEVKEALALERSTQRSLLVQNRHAEVFVAPSRIWGGGGCPPLWPAGGLTHRNKKALEPVDPIDCRIPPVDLLIEASAIPRALALGKLMNSNFVGWSSGIGTRSGPPTPSTAGAPSTIPKGVARQLPAG